MNEENEFKRLRQLCDHFYQRQIDFANYRTERKQILDKLEEELNRLPQVARKETTTQPRPRLEREDSEQQAADVPQDHFGPNAPK